MDTHSDSPSVPVRLFTLMLRLYPRSFRQQFESEMAQVLKAHYIDSAAGGIAATQIRFWGPVIYDIARTAGRERASQVVGAFTAGGRHMKAILVRNCSVAVAFLAAGAMLLQVELVVSEGTSEMVAMGLEVLLVLALFWACSSLKLSQSKLFRRGTQALIACVIAVALNAVLYFYSWHVRPALGIYEEPSWVTHDIR